jgi:SPX domain protein involved in polyphosphate accumulation
MQSTETLPATADMNLATFIKVVKKIDTVGHYYTGDQLHIRFNITAAEMEAYTTEYLNSIFATYDSIRRNFLRLLKRTR